MHYVNNTKLVHSRWNIDYTTDYKFVLGASFEDYKFSINRSVSFEHAVRDHLIQLRHQHSYLRFWFSGGPDSRIVLDTAFKYNIVFDEIVMIRYVPTDPLVVFCNLAEIDRCAIPVAQHYKEKFASTKLTVINCDNNYFDWFYSDPKWYKKFMHFCYVEPGMMKGIYEYNQYHRILDDADQFDLFGFQQPNIWFDTDQQCWKFLYVDHAFNQIMDAPESICTGSGAAVLNAYLSELIPQFELLGYFPKRFKETVTGREQKNMLPLFKNQTYPAGSILMPKTHTLTVYPTADKFWHVTSGYSDELHNLIFYGLDQRPSSFENWAFKSDWDEILLDFRKGGVLSQEFVFQT
jgi:hypothetical protein